MTRPAALRLSPPARLALRLLGAGGLYRGASGDWRSRAFPDQRVAHQTVKALVANGLARTDSYVGLHDEQRCCACITQAGKDLYAGRPAPPPRPITAEALLVEVEAGLERLGRDQAALNRALAELRRAKDELWARAQAVGHQLEAMAQTIRAHEAEQQRLDHAARTLESRRAEIRPLVVEAGRMLMAQARTGDTA